MPQQNHSPKAIIYYIPQKPKEVNMAKRRAMRSAKDKRVFTQTANKVKKINVKPRISRGGIRL